MAHGLAGSWQALAGLRGLLGLAEGSANPAGHEGDRRVVPRPRARPRRRASTTSAPPSARCWRRRSWPGRSSSYNWQSAFVITGGLGLVWLFALALASTSRPRATRPSPPPSATTSPRGRRPHLAGRRPPPVDAQHRCASATSGASPCPASWPIPTWGTLTFWVPLYLTKARALRPQADRALRLAAVPGRGPRLPVRRRARDCGSRSAASASSTPAAGPSPAGACLMMGIASWVTSWRVPTAAIALICLGGFAHQTLSVTVITMASDLFKRNEVATVAGMAGTLRQRRRARLLPAHRGAW